MLGVDTKLAGVKKQEFLCKKKTRHKNYLKALLTSTEKLKLTFNNKKIKNLIIHF